MTGDRHLTCTSCGATILALNASGGRCRNRWICRVWHDAAARAAYLADYRRTFRAAHGIA